MGKSQGAKRDGGEIKIKKENYYPYFLRGPNFYNLCLSHQMPLDCVWEGLIRFNSRSIGPVMEVVH